MPDADLSDFFMLACRDLIPHSRGVGGFSSSYFNVFHYEQKQGPPRAQIYGEKTPAKYAKSR